MPKWLSLTGTAAMVKKIMMVITLTLAFSTPAAAQDFEQGLAAQKRGDVTAAYRIWHPLAERGDGAAQNAIGLLYDNGEGVPQDHGRALAWYRKAARQGHADAQYNLALMYANGLAVRQNYDTALMWYRKAADQGHREAKVNLDVLYLMGHVTRKGESQYAQTQRARSGLKNLKTAKSTSSGAARPQKNGARPKAQAVAHAVPAGKSGSRSVEGDQATAEARDARTDVVAAIGKSSPRSGAGPAGAPSPAEVPGAAESPLKAKTQPPAPSGDFRVQLSSVKTELRAMKEVSRLKQAHQSLLGPLEIEPVRADLGDRGVYYRLRAGPISDWNSAKSLCRALSSRNQGCIVVRK
jgi:tetratricopeptide (TPR) repeat protein